MKRLQIPRWSWYFLITSLRIIGIGAFAGALLFPLIGIVIKTDHTSLQLALIGIQSLGLCASFIGPIAGLILTARRIQATASEDEPLPPPTEEKS